MLSMNGVDKYYSAGGMLFRKRQRILRDIHLSVAPGECLGIIGESGSGKSTIGRLLLGIERPDSGKVLLEGLPVSRRSVRAGRVSAVFQDYTSSIHPFYTVEQALCEPVAALPRSSAYRQELPERLDFWLEQVGLSSAYRKKYAHELSGGEAQRVCIARAVLTRPQFVVMDEAISSLDVSVQAQVLELLKQLKETYGMGYVFITHDIQAAAYLCERLVILKSGRIEETVDVSKLGQVRSDYARRLLASSIVL